MRETKEGGRKKVAKATVGKNVDTFEGDGEITSDEEVEEGGKKERKGGRDWEASEGGKNSESGGMMTGGDGGDMMTIMLMTTIKIMMIKR